MNQEDQNNKLVRDIFKKAEKNSSIEDMLKVLGFLTILFGSILSIILCAIFSSFIPLLSVIGSIITGILFFALAEIISLLREISNNTKK